MKRRITLAALVLVSTAASAASWKGEADLGLVATQGNTNTSTLNAAFQVENQHREWRHALRLEALNSSDQGGTTAERYVGELKTTYDFSQASFWFGNLRYEADRFSGYAYQASESVGYGRRFHPYPSVHAELQAGPGLRQSRQEGESGRNEPIFRAAAGLTWALSTSAKFDQRLRIEGGRSNTTVESVSSLQSQIVGNLALKLAETVKFNSNVPVGTKRTDFLSSVNLVYSF